MNESTDNTNGQELLKVKELKTYFAVKKGLLSNPGSLEPFGDSRPGTLTVEEHVDLSMLIAPYWS